MTEPDIKQPEPVKPPKPPAPPAAPATQTNAQQEQSTPEKPESSGEKKQGKGRNSLRIPRKQSKGLNLPGSGGGSK